MDYKKDDAYKINDDYYTVSLIDDNKKPNDSLNNDTYSISQDHYELVGSIDKAEKPQENLIYIDGRGDYELNKRAHDVISKLKDGENQQSLVLEYNSVVSEKEENNGYFGKRKDRSKKIKQFEISNSIQQRQMKALSEDFDDSIANTSKVNKANNSTNSKTRYYTNTQPKDEAMPYFFKIILVLFFIALTFEIFLPMIEEAMLSIKG